MKYKRILLKLSGESLQGGQKYGLSPETLQSYAEQIKAAAATGVQIGIVTDARRVAFGDELGEPGGDEGRLAQGHVLQLASGDPRLMPPEALHVVLVILQRHDVAAGYGPLWAKRKNFIDNGCGHDELLFRPPCPPMPPFPTLNKFLRSAPLLLLRTNKKGMADALPSAMPPFDYRRPDEPAPTAAAPA